MGRDEKVLIIINFKSGIFPKKINLPKIFGMLEKRFHTVALMNSNSAEHTKEIIDKHLDYYDIFAVYGGDGTINSIAKLLINTGKTVSIIPGGSGNGMATNLKIPMIITSAVNVLINGRDIDIDTGLINGHHFFNIAGIGLDGYIASRFEQSSRTRGVLPYFYYGFMGYFKMKPHRVKIEIGADSSEEDILLLAIANFRQYGSHVIIAPKASPCDTYLDLCTINKPGLIKSALNLPDLFTGKLNKYPFYKSEKVKKVTINSLTGAVPYHYDGEYGKENTSRFEISVVPKSLRVRVPKKSKLPS